MAEAARNWFVRGRVQGVGFRNFVERQAAGLPLKGWVRNLADGRVEVFAQGPSQSLDELQGRLWAGPRWAEVRDVEVREASPEAGLKDFRVR